MVMHHVLIVLTLTVTQVHTDHGNNKCSIISEIIQAIPIKFAVEIIRLKVYIIFSQLDELAINSLKVTTASQICVSITLTLMPGHSVSTKANNQS